MTKTIEPTQAEKNELLANELRDFVGEHKLGDISIYFNNQCYRLDSEGKVEVLTDIKGSTYFEYANDETVSMSFEGPLNYILNYGEIPALYHAFNEIFVRHGCYFELGFAWSLSVYY